MHKMAHLARLGIPEEQEAQMLDDLRKILHWAEQLQEVDTDGVAPLTSITQVCNVLRPDIPGPHLDREKALKNAPKKDAEFFRVPKFLDQ